MARKPTRPAARSSPAARKKSPARAKAASPKAKPGKAQSAKPRTPKKQARPSKTPARKPAAKAPRKPTTRPASTPTLDPSRTPLLRASLAVSLDGYIADTSGSVDWLYNFFSPEIDFMGFLRTIGATIYGRTTFDWALAQGHAGPADPAAPGGKAIVLTRRPLENPPAGVEAFSGDVRELATRLRAELAGTGKDIWLMGGGQSISPFHEAGLVDRWELSFIPILLGNGIPLFPAHSRGFGSLKLTRNRILKNGIVEAWYEPVRD